MGESKSKCGVILVQLFARMCNWNKTCDAGTRHLVVFDVIDLHLQSHTGKRNGRTKQSKYWKMRKALALRKKKKKPSIHAPQHRLHMTKYKKNE